MASAGRRKKGFSVLVVDDSPVYRQLVSEALGARKDSVFLAETGAEALKLFERHRPPLVITDWLMPDLSGIELCRQIRERFQGSSYTYIILLTSMSDKEHVVSGLAAGADDYLTKPFHPEELLARIGVGTRILALQSQLEEQNRLLEEASRTDVLTNLPNRRAIEEWSTRQIRAAMRYGFPFWVVLADLDRFKNINDTYGHKAGDIVLSRFGAIMGACTRGSDMCGRLGGEEFLLILTHTGRENVPVVVDRIRRKFEAESFVFGGRTVHVTASFGVAGFQGKQKQAPDLAHLIQEADRALYEAKHAGRNRVKMETTTPTLR
jgi:two-component system cell cycle response regulator